MLLSAVSVLVVAQSSSEIPEGLMNNPVFARFSDTKLFSRWFMYTIHFIIMSDLVDIILFRHPIFTVFFPFNIHDTSVYCFHVFVYTCLIYGL